MATTNTTSDLTPDGSTEIKPALTLLVSLSSMDSDDYNRLLENLQAAFPHEVLTVASTDAAQASASTSGDTTGKSVDQPGSFRVVGYTPSVIPADDWTLTAPDFVNAYDLARQYDAAVVLLLGPDAHTLSAEELANLAAPVLSRNADLAVAHYALPPRTGLVNSGILYPLSRALFNSRARFPLALDLCMSLRMAQRMAAAAQRFTSTSQPNVLVWPVSEAAVAGMAIVQVETPVRALPRPAESDLRVLLAEVTGSLFAEVEQKAAFWQRSRPPQAPHVFPLPKPEDCGSISEIEPMVEAFRLASGNLHEIWSLVLPPHTMLGLKRLAAQPPATFAMPDALWARIVFDFLLAHRLRTINRGHLLGALTPLYLAWVASHIRSTAEGCDPERHIEAVAAAFETDKPYLVSRWRWPDRFNP